MAKSTSENRRRKVLRFTQRSHYYLPSKFDGDGSFAALSHAR
jgi:hypothetical protein